MLKISGMRVPRKEGDMREGCPKRNGGYGKKKIGFHMGNERKIRMKIEVDFIL